MTCFRPRPAWRATEPNQNGKYPITFSKRTSQLEHDFLIPCGKCTGCAADRRMEWGIRMYHESITSKRSAFITLTYADEYMPENGQLSKTDAQLFLARLRKKIGPIRYYLTGEYGDKTKRPHYHAIVFNEDFRDDSYRFSNSLYGSYTLDQLWGKGMATAGNVNLASAFYTAGYAGKKINDPDTFNIMSRKPPIGYQWAQDNIETINRMGRTVIQGTEYPIPKTYYKWHHPSQFRPDPLDISESQGNRQGHVKEFTSEELRQKERHFKAGEQLKQEKEKI